MRRLLAVLALVVIVALPQSAIAASVAATYPVGTQPYGVIADPVNGHVYVANNGGTTVSAVDPVTGVVTSVGVGSQPGLMALDSTGRRLYVSNSGDLTLSLIDLTTMRVTATSLDAGGLGVAVDPVAQRVYAARGTEMAELDANLNFLTLSSPGGTSSWFGVAVDSSLHRVYVTNIDVTSPSLVVLDGTNLDPVATVPLPQPARFGIAVDATTHAIYLGSDPATNGAFYVVDPTSLQVVHTTALGGHVGGIALDPARHRIYVTDMTNSQLFELDDQTFALADVTHLPWVPALLATHQDGRVYVAANSAGLLAALTVGNQAPVVDSVTFSPASPFTNDTLVANVKAHDPDNDALTFTYAWSRNGTVLPGATGSSLDLSTPGNGDKGDTIGVVVTASDGKATASGSASVVVLNSPPTVSAALAPTSPLTNDTLVANASAHDADNDALTLTYAWSRNGAVLPGATGSSLDLSTPGNGDKGDTISVDVAASDGQATATARASVVVGNSPPTASVTLAPSSPGTNALLTATTTGTDPDGDKLTFTYEWSRNGTVLSGVTGSSLDLSTPGNGDKGDTISVVATASDGLATATSSRESVVVADSGPSVSVALAPSSPGTDSLLTATATGTDPDGDTLTYTFTWKVNGVVREVTPTPNAADGFDLSLPGNGDLGDIVTVEVVASDGTIDSSVASANATIGNSAPTVTVSLSDPTPRKKDTLVATAVGQDADSEVLTYTFTWRVNGNIVQTTTTSDMTDSLDLFNVASNNDTIRVTVVANDGIADSAPASATATLRQNPNASPDH